MTNQKEVIEKIKQVVQEIGVTPLIAHRADMIISKDKGCEDSYNLVVSRDFMDEAYDHFDFYKLQDLADELGVDICPCSGATHATTIFRF